MVARLAKGGRQKDVDMHEIFRSRCTDVTEQMIDLDR